VDSSVAAALLLKKGYNVIGVHMQNWSQADEQRASSCTSQNDFNDVCKVGNQLNFPVHQVSFEKTYWTEVFTPTLEDYCQGFTPNPDVLCNKEIKFKRLLEYVQKKAKCRFSCHWTLLSKKHRFNWTTIASRC